MQWAEEHHQIQLLISTVYNRLYYEKNQDIKGYNVFNPKNADPEFGRSEWEIKDLNDPKVYIYSIKGRLIKALDVENRSGTYYAYWYGKGPGGKTMPAGTYLYQITEGGKIKRNGFVGIAR